MTPDVQAALERGGVKIVPHGDRRMLVLTVGTSQTLIADPYSLSNLPRLLADAILNAEARLRAELAKGEAKDE